MDQEKLRALVVTAVRLAIVRHDLATDDCPTIGDEDAKTIAMDVWDAMNGVGTCAGETVPELLALAARPADDAGKCGRCGNPLGDAFDSKDHVCPDRPPPLDPAREATEEQVRNYVDARLLAHLEVHGVPMTEYERDACCADFRAGLAAAHALAAELATALEEALQYVQPDVDLLVKEYSDLDGTDKRTRVECEAIRATHERLSALLSRYRAAGRGMEGGRES